jgi:S-adenosylmethionine/arginine decarboxylase-like enzyme
VFFPKARYESIHLRLHDFKFVGEYNFVMFRITSDLKLCGEKITDKDMLEKIFFTFHASNLLLQQQYRERGFKKYSELI